MDDSFMKPLLTHSNPTLMETMPGCCLPLARLLTSNEQLAKHPAMMSQDQAITDDTDFSRYIFHSSNATHELSNHSAWDWTLGRK